MLRRPCLAFAALCFAAPLLAPSAVPAQSGAEETARIVHLLNRAAFGPTFDEVERIRAIGRHTWVAEQIAPDAIPDPTLATRLEPYRAIHMDSTELLENYPQQRAGEPRRGIGGPGRVRAEAGAAQVTRAVHAKAQLREVLTDFWFNHFSVAANAGPNRYAIVPYIRDTIRPRVLGRFEDLLRATAESPAMLYYLDNYLSSSPGRGRRRGINENYARELMELHTMGVDGGYTQADVEAVAAAFTGWTFTPANSGVVAFVFTPNRHVGGDKTVLGTRIPAGGRSEGDAILRLLSRHPSTAEFIATKLVRRFVSDDPPQALVEKARDVFLATNGHLGWVVTSILTSAEFYDPKYRNAKVKSPLETVASTLRALEADVRIGVTSTQQVANLGQPMFAAPAPTGWPEVAEETISAGAMVSRFGFAYRAASAGLSGVRIQVDLWSAIHAVFGPTGLAQYVLHATPGAATVAALQQAAAEGGSTDLLLAVALASPEFQLH